MDGPRLPLATAMRDSSPMLVTLRLRDLEELFDRRLAEVAPSLPRILTTSQCAEWLGVTPQAVNKWCRSRDMPHLSLGTERRFEPEEVMRWARASGRIIEPPPETNTRHLRAVKAR